MEKELNELAIGAILHDIGKVCYRAGDGRAHSISGYELLKQFIENESILSSVKYHHYSYISNAHISDDSNAYITYVADNIASGSDRRETEGEDSGFDKRIPLSSVFNIINGADDKNTYEADTLEHLKGINYPTDKPKNLTEEFYKKILLNITDALKHSELSNINSIMQILEANLSYVPSSTNLAEVPDISLYDHSKLTAGLALCIKYVLNSKNITDYKTEILRSTGEFYKAKNFLIYSFDLSGIQKFIYMATNNKVLKNLRARSFYLEMLAEHICDELLDNLELCRTNLLYLGGGHAYMILPNTEKAIKVIEDEAGKINSWLLSEFKTDLYMSYAYQEASANDLMNKEEHAYSNIFIELSKKLNYKKMSRYKAEEILKLNSQKNIQNIRECVNCRRSDNLTEEDICKLCDSFSKYSQQIADNDYFGISTEDEGIELPNGKYMIPLSEDRLLKLLKEDKLVRFYSKNKMYTGSNISSSLWMGDYTTKDTFEEFSDKATGIDRIAVLRADVDNLGKAFTRGFEEKYNTISRTATFSRQMSLFFKYHINQILEKGKFSLTDTGNVKRNATIVYSGGDDLFIVGSWDSVLEIAIDLNNSFKRFVTGNLTLSAGFGIYTHSYPIARIAEDVGELEDCSKNIVENEKNKITLFEDSGEHTYFWNELENEVIGQKLKVVREYFDNTEGHGSSLIYKLVEYLRNVKEKINIPRFLYLITRVNKEEESPEAKENLSKLFDWVNNTKDRKQLITTLYLYVYLKREGEDE